MCDMMGFAGSSSHVSLSSREKTDNHEEKRSPSRAWADPSLAVVLVLLGSMLWQMRAMCAWESGMTVRITARVSEAGNPPPPYLELP